MLIQDILRTALPQWTFVCELCGEVRQKSGPNQKCCDACRDLKNKKYHQARYDRNIGDSRDCNRCKILFVIDHSTRTLCEKCRRKPRSTPKCVNCKSTFIRRSARQKYCDSCKAIRIQREKRTHYLAKKQDTEFRKKRSAEARRWQGLKYKTDPQFSICKRMSARIAGSLSTGKAGRSWETLVDYTVVDLIRHLERGFLKGMTWENRGLWHIDHIQPLASFTFTGPDDPDFKAAWALTNLRPMWALDNIRKNATRTLLL